MESKKNQINKKRSPKMRNYKEEEGKITTNIISRNTAEEKQKNGKKVSN